MDASKFLRDIKKRPQQVLTKAKQAKTQNELLELANWWQEDAPRLINLGVLEVFVAHLDEHKIPRAVVSNRRTPVVEKAFLSLHGLSKSHDFQSYPSPQTDVLVKAWPSIFKWSTFFYTVDIQRPDADDATKRTAQYLIARTWYSISRVNGIMLTMAKTNGAVELMTQLILTEDSTMDNFHDAALTLAGFVLATDGKDILDRIVAAVNGEAELIARFCLFRLRTIVNSPSFSTAAGMAIITLVGVLSEQTGHPLRFAFLHHNLIQVVTKAAGTAAKLLTKGGSSFLEAAMVSAFSTLSNCIESTDGFTWVTSAVQSGLLQAFVDASIFLERLKGSARDLIMSLFKDILPKYLVYRSVIQAVDRALQKVEASPSSRWVDNTPAKDVWQRFKNLTLDRMRLVKKVAASKGNMIMSCDNLKCQKLDYRSNFKKCGACSTSVYCSKECQAIAWKECDHRTMCKLKVQERLEGKSQPFSKADEAFFHSLTVETISRHLPSLENLAAKEYSGVPMEQLVTRVDYTSAEPAYHFQPLDEYKHCKTGGSNTVEARKEILIKHVEDNASKFCLLESFIANGEHNQIIVSLGDRNFWNTDGAVRAVADVHIDG